MRTSISFVTAAAFTVALSGTVATATAGRGRGNSANAHLCQKGGWTKLQRSDGTQFKTRARA